MPSPAELSLQFTLAKRAGWLPFFRAAAAAYQVPTEVLMAIASRETNMQNILGDRDDYGPHGFGIMQIDNRYYPEWCRNGRWQDVKEAIRMGAFVLRSKMNEAIAHKVRAADLMRVATALYNGSRAIEDHEVHNDPDLHTTHHDYAHDVLDRAIYFKSWL